MFGELMSNHKRRKRKDRRAGCLMCKPHKGNGMKRACMKHKHRVARFDAGEQVKESKES